MKNNFRIINFIAITAVLLCALITVQMIQAQSDCSKADEHFAKGKDYAFSDKHGHLHADKAEAEFSLYIACKPNRSEGYSNRAYAKVWNAGLSPNFDSALADINKALALNSQDSTAYLVRGLIASETKNYEAAIKDYSEAIRLEPGNMESYEYRSLAYASKQEFDKAIPDISRAIELSPKDATLYNYRGLIYSMQNNYGLAIDDYQQALEIRPYSSQAKDGLQSVVTKLSLKELGEIFDKRFSKLKRQYELMNTAALVFISSLLTKPEPDDATVCRGIEINKNLLDLVKKDVKGVLFIKLRDDLAEQQQVFTDYINKVEAKITVDEKGYQAYSAMHKCK